MIIKRLLTKSLASQFSLTGLGPKRSATKISFKDHGIARPVTGKLLSSSYVFKLTLKEEQGVNSIL